MWLCVFWQAVLDRESNKKTGPSDEAIIENFKRCAWVLLGIHPLHLLRPETFVLSISSVCSWYACSYHRECRQKPRTTA